MEIESIRTFLEKELRNIEAEIYEIGAKHGMELDYLESRRDDMLKAMEKINWHHS